MLPGWYGLGSGSGKAAEQFGDDAFREMFREWYFLRSLTADAEMVLAKSDLGIAELYSQLAGELHDEFFPIIRDEHELTRKLILEYSGSRDVAARATSRCSDRSCCAIRTSTR